MNFCSTAMINYTRERHTRCFRVVTHDKNILRFPCPYDGNLVKKFTLLSSTNPFQLNITCWNWFTCHIVLNINFQNLKFCNIKWSSHGTIKMLPLDMSVVEFSIHPQLPVRKMGDPIPLHLLQKLSLAFVFPPWSLSTSFSQPEQQKHICANASVGRAYALLLDSLLATHAVQYM